MRAARVLHPAGPDAPPVAAPDRSPSPTRRAASARRRRTVNLGVALALYGLRVLVIDLDPQGNASTALGVEHTVGHAVGLRRARRRDHRWPRSSTRRTASPDLLLRAGHHRPGRRRDRAGLAWSPASTGCAARGATCRSCSTERASDYVLIDCPPSLGLLTLNALVAGDEVLIPIQCEYYALEGLGQLLNNIDLVRAHLNPGIAVSHDPADDVRRPDEAGRPGRRRGAQPLRRPGAARGDPPQRAGVRGARATASRCSPTTRARAGSTSYVEAAREIAERGCACRRSTGPAGRPDVAAGVVTTSADAHDRPSGVTAGAQKRGGWAAGWRRSSRPRPDPERRRPATVARTARPPRPSEPAPAASRPCRRRAGSPRPRRRSASRRAAARDRRRRRRPQPASSRAGRSTTRRWTSSATRSASSACCSRSSSARARPGSYELVMGERRLRAASAAGLDTVPGDRPRHHRRRDAARRAAGEHPPGPAQPARGGGGLPAAARGVRRHPRGAGRPDRPQPLAGHQHDPAAEAAGEGADAGSPPACSPPGTPGRCSACDDAEAQDALATRIVAEGMSVRATEEAVAMARRREPPTSRAGKRRPISAPGVEDLGRAAVRQLRDQGQGRRSAGPRGGSSSSSARSTTCSGSSA